MRVPYHTQSCRTKLATNAQETRNVVAPIQDALGRIGTIQAELYIYSN